MLTLPLETTRGHVAVVDDDTHVFATSLRANLALAAPEADDAAIEAALTDAGLASLTTELPAGLDTVLGSGGRGLSGGQAPGSASRAPCSASGRSCCSTSPSRTSTRRRPAPSWPISRASRKHPSPLERWSW